MLLYALALVGQLAGSMKLELVLPASVRQRQAIEITLRLINTSRKPVTVYLQGRPIAFDVIVTHEDGRPVWRRLKGAVIPSILQVRVLQPGETVEFSDTWRQQDDLGQPIPAGRYLVTGVLPADPPEEFRSSTELLRILP